ncbi:hypothetical protein [Brucella tritici]|uniref:hypothetical protein n=1 Tax=Brucella tritici TaxID=94626 RepID=UPI002000708E|nr:hypothetical protein [Brucella tritici]
MTETASALVKPDNLGNPEFLLTTNVASLRSALQLTAFPRSHFPVLSMVRFQDGEITATDLDVCIKAKVPAMEAYGAALAPHRELQAIANSLRADTQITLRSRKGGIAGAGYCITPAGRELVSTRPAPVDGSPLTSNPVDVAEVECG